MKLPNRQAFSWALYDWANSAFATTVMAGFFPVFFKEYWASGLPAGESTFWLGAANSLAAVLVVLLAPLLGLWSDRRGMKHRLLLGFATLGVIMTGALFIVAQGYWPLALLLYIGGILGFSGGNVAYDAMLPGLVKGQDSLERLSALGFALGYLGGAVLFAINIAMVLAPQSFGLADSAEAVRWSFAMVAVWWAVFSLPIMLWVQEPQPAATSEVAKSLPSWRGLLATWRELRALPMAMTFLFAYWLYIDGVDTIVRMAVDYGLSIGFNSNDLLTALLITQLVGFPAALVFGRLGDRIGAKRSIVLAIGVYVLVVIWASRMQSAFEFYALAVLIGLVQGGIQALSRALFARLVPTAHAGRFFGLYNMLGKFAAVIGPIMVGWITWWFNSPRAGILSILLLFGLGLLLLARVNVAQGEAQANGARV